jgi:hypothetical protein
VPERDIVGRPLVVYFSIIPTDVDTAPPTLRDRLRTALSFHVLR